MRMQGDHRTTDTAATCAVCADVLRVVEVTRTDRRRASITMFACDECGTRQIPTHAARGTYFDVVMRAPTKRRPLRTALAG